MNARYWSHYNWLDSHFYDFLIKVADDPKRYRFGYGGIIESHGDKCYSYKAEWEKAGIPFSHGVAIYLLTYISPWSSEVRTTPNGFISPGDWVVNNYKRFEPFLTKVDLEKVDIL